MRKKKDREREKENGSRAAKIVM